MLISRGLDITRIEMATLQAYGREVVERLVTGARGFVKLVGLTPPAVPAAELVKIANVIAYPVRDFGFLSPIKYEDAASIQKISAGQTGTLDTIVDLEGRGHLFYARLRDGREAFAKPYKSTSEREALERLRETGVSTVIGTNDGYFVEQKPAARLIEDILNAGASNLREVTGLLGEAIYLAHSSGVVYGGKFNGHVFADTIEKKITISDFTATMLAHSPSGMRVDIVRALRYIEFLADYDTILRFHAGRGKSESKRKRFEEVRQRYFYDAIVSFIANYAIHSDDGGRNALIDALRQISSGEEQKGMLIMAANRFLNRVVNSKTSTRKAKGKKQK